VKDLLFAWPIESPCGDPRGQEGAWGVRAHRPGDSSPLAPDASERVHEPSWDDRLPVLATLAVPRNQQAPAEVDILDPQSEALLQTETATLAGEGADWSRPRARV
jgi:hypothetical protein